MLITDQTSYTSDAINQHSQAIAELYVTITGPGPVYIEQQSADGSWAAYPETTFEGDQAKIVAIRRGQYRVRIDATAATTVEIR